MSTSNISLIIQREFNERVRKKSFIISTILMPVMVIALMVAPALIMEFSKGEQKRIAVIDPSGLVAPQLASDEELRFETTDLTPDEARRQLTDRFGVEVGAQTFYNSLTGRWETLPIVAPYYKFNKFKLQMDFGPIWFELIRGAIQKHRGGGGGCVGARVGAAVGWGGSGGVQGETALG